MFQTKFGCGVEMADDERQEFCQKCLRGDIDDIFMPISVESLLNGFEKN